MNILTRTQIIFLAGRAKFTLIGPKGQFGLYMYPYDHRLDEKTFKFDI